MSLKQFLERMMNNNEDPQKIYLIAKIEELEKSLKTTLKQSDEAIKLAKVYKEKYDDLVEEVEMFNMMPWYERLIHKFDV